MRITLFISSILVLINSFAQNSNELKLQLENALENNDIKTVSKTLKSLTKNGTNLSEYKVLNGQNLLRYALLAENTELVELLKKYEVEEEKSGFEGFDYSDYSGLRYAIRVTKIDLNKKRTNLVQERDKIQGKEGLEKYGNPDQLKKFSEFVPQKDFIKYRELISSIAFDLIHEKIDSRVIQTNLFDKVSAIAKVNMYLISKYEIEKGNKDIENYRGRLSKSGEDEPFYDHYEVNRYIKYSKSNQASSHDLEWMKRRFPDLSIRSEILDLYSFLDSDHKTRLNGQLMDEIRNSINNSMVFDSLTHYPEYKDKLSCLNRYYFAYAEILGIDPLDSMKAKIEEKYYSIIAENTDQIWSEIRIDEATGNYLTKYVKVLIIGSKSYKISEEDFAGVKKENYPSDILKYIYDWSKEQDARDSKAREEEIRKEIQAKIDKFYKQEFLVKAFADKNGYVYLNEMTWSSLAPTLKLLRTYNGLYHSHQLKNIFNGDFGSGKIDWTFKLLFNSFCVVNSGLYTRYLPSNYLTKKFETTTTRKDGYGFTLSQSTDSRSINLHPRMAAMYDKLTPDGDEISGSENVYRLLPPELLRNFLYEFGPGTKAYEQLFENLVRYAEGKKSIQETLTRLKSKEQFKNQNVVPSPSEKSLEYSCYEQLFGFSEDSFKFCDCIDSNKSSKFSQDYQVDFRGWLEENKKYITNKCFN